MQRRGRGTATICKLSPFFSGNQEMELEELVYDGYYVSEVLYQMKSGKEATVFCCAAEPHTGLEYIAAKVYRPLAERSFRNDAVYQQGRQILDARLRRAYRNKSKAGRNVQYSNWVSAEYNTMRLLYSEGANIPEPYAQTGSAILMEFFGDDRGPAPTLNHVHLSEDEASTLFDEILRNIALFLQCGRVHADLSPFNILYRDGEYRIIDFPQSVDPASNTSAFDLLYRDIENVRRYLDRNETRPSAYDIASKVWEENTDRNSVMG